MSEPRTKTIGLRLTPEEYAKLASEAERAGEKPTTYAYLKLREALQ